ncbi:MAG TPA: VCBS repeat-containing protein, partial [Mucilaginibacter sp.]|nr:VCBS repeat-containing protein [Mucilaginibacter sp.]
PRVLQNDSLGAPAFSEIAFMSGIAQTDWSWTPVITDFNNDGYRDVIITNGFPKDVTDHDFMVYRQNAYAIGSKKQVLEQIPSVKIHNYAYRNKGDLTFQDESKDWGLSVPSFSNGAVYTDLDNDGAMDMIVNNINDEAFVYRNTSREKDSLNTHYIQVKFKGSAHNLNGLGAWADIYYDHGKHQVSENNPYRGYLSTDENIAHFGLGKIAKLDSVVVRWPNGKKQVLKDIKADQVLTADIANAKDTYLWDQPKTAYKTLFTEVDGAKNIRYHHDEGDFIDFNIQKLIPHKLSEYSPALAAADVDGNGLDDIIISGNAALHAQLFLQQADGKFARRDLFPDEKGKFTESKDEGVLLFDANGDGKPDVYIASGGYKDAPGSANYQDRLYINDGKGDFKLVADALPVDHTSKLCVRAVDYNKDGKLDLFVSGRVDPWNYPKPVSSCILRNDSHDGVVKFTNVTNEVAPALKNIGMVCDGLFTDFDGDGWPDLVMAGEWMPVTFLKNDRGKFVNVTSCSGTAGQLGLWNSIVAGDFRHTGRMDYIVGNLGENSLLQASDKYPIYITAKDFDKSGYSAIPSIFLPDENGDKKEFPMHGRDDMLKQMISVKKKYTNYKSYATATMDDILSPEQRKGALRLKANILKSCYLRNDGNGKFTMIPLPAEAQFSTLNGMVTGDFDGDGNLDVAINGNDYGTDVSIGRYDAFNGLVLKGDGKGGFKPMSIAKSGIYIPGNGKALVKLRDNKGNLLLAASQHEDFMKVFQLNSGPNIILPAANDSYALITYKNGQTEKQEFYYGSSFLSQSARFIHMSSQVTGITFFDNKGKSRTISIH